MTLRLAGADRQVMTRDEALADGYYPFTYGYHPRSEAWMLDRVASDLDKFNTEFAVVFAPDPHYKDESDYVEIWKRSYSNPTSACNGG